MEMGRADHAPATEWLAALCDAQSAEILHVNGYALAASPIEIPVVVAAHSCVLSWHEAVHRAPAGKAWARYARAVQCGLDAAATIVAPTAAMLAEVERLYDFRHERLVIPNGRSGERQHACAKEPFVLGVGRVWDEAKNLAALERVAPALEWPVIVAGAGGSLGHLGARDVAELFARASVFSSPARYEPFGLAALEAGLCGCALVLGDIASLREVWGDAALFVDPFDDLALESALRTLIDEAELRARLAAAARRRAVEYTPERMAQQYTALYTRLSAGLPDPAAAAH
jgi:glycosyltransferase involved in cell wall biosynthesis